MLNPVIDSALCSVAETSLNTLIKHDTHTASVLSGYTGRSVRVRSGQWLSLLATFSDQGIRLSLQNEDEADACITASTAQLIRLALSEDKADALMNGDIDLTGSSALIMDLAEVFQTLDIDWEEVIAPLTGGVVAHSLGKSMRSLFRWGADSQSTMQTAGKEYLEEEAHVLVPAALAEHFSEQVDQLRMATDRAEARIAQLSQQLKKKNNQDRPD